MKKAAVIIGMHRSGTSAIAGLVSHFGFDTGKDILPPADDNIKGFYENSRILAFNDQLLHRLGARWHSTYLVPPDWFKSGIFNDESVALGSILRDQFNEDQRILLKDPRICVLLPIYIEAFRLLHIEPVFILSVRHPDAVASSLARRNGFSYGKTLMLWMDHVIRSEYYTRGHNRLFVVYEKMLCEPDHTCAELFTLLEPGMALPDEVRSNVAAFVDKNLNHAGISIHTSPGKLPETAKMFFDLMSNLHLKDTGKCDVESLDKIRNEFNNMLELSFLQPNGTRFNLIIESDSKEPVIISRQLVPGSNQLEFDLNKLSPIKKLTIAFENQSPGIIVRSAEAGFADGGQVQLLIPERANTVETDEGILILEHEKPFVDIQLPIGKDIIHLSFILSVLSAPQTVDAMLLVKNYAKKAKHLEIDKQLILNSFTWKLGHFICAPFKLFSGIFFKRKHTRELNLYKEQE